MRKGIYPYPLLASLALFIALLWLWPGVYTHYDPPPLAWMAGVLAGLALLASGVPLGLWLWWGLGLLTLAWSLTPGNTLAVGLWELAYLAAFAAGRWAAAWVWWGLLLFLLGYGLFTTLSLAWAGLVQFFSGSAHYVAGAQALLLVPIALWGLFRWPWRFGPLAVAAVYLALSSGARAVYLPLLCILALLLYRLWREGTSPAQLALWLGGVALLVWAIDAALPFHPVQTALLGKAAPEQQLQALAPEGSFGTRLAMWHQTLLMALEHPLGTGNGSFRDILPAYLRYPGVLYSSAHNYYLEQAATGGWLRLLVWLGLLGWMLWRGWKTPAWPWALGMGGLWATLAFDITGAYPAVMMLAFASLGMTYGQIQKIAAGQTTPRQRIASIAGTALAIGLAAWWYWPCTADCATDRHLGYRPEVLRLLREAPPQERQALLDKAAQRNPKSLWVWRARLEGATGQERLHLLREVTQRFPLVSPGYYLERARLAWALGFPEEAIATLEQGLAHFPPGFKVYQAANFFGALSPVYQEWEEEAPRLLTIWRGR